MHAPRRLTLRRVSQRSLAAALTALLLATVGMTTAAPVALAAGEVSVVGNGASGSGPAGSNFFYARGPGRRRGQPRGVVPRLARAGSRSTRRASPASRSTASSIVVGGERVGFGPNPGRRSYFTLYLTDNGATGDTVAFDGPTSIDPPDCGSTGPMQQTLSSARVTIVTGPSDSGHVQGQGTSPNFGTAIRTFEFDATRPSPGQRLGHLLDHRCPSISSSGRSSASTSGADHAMIIGQPSGGWSSGHVLRNVLRRRRRAIRIRRPHRCQRLLADPARRPAWRPRRRSARASITGYIDVNGVGWRHRRRRQQRPSSRPAPVQTGRFQSPTASTFAPSRRQWRRRPARSACAGPRNISRWLDHLPARRRRPDRRRWAGHDVGRRRRRWRRADDRLLHALPDRQRSGWDHGHGGLRRPDQHVHARTATRRARPAGTLWYGQVTIVDGPSDFGTVTGTGRTTSASGTRGRSRSMPSRTEAAGAVSGTFSFTESHNGSPTFPLSGTDRLPRHPRRPRDAHRARPDPQISSSAPVHALLHR